MRFVSWGPLSGTEEIFVFVDGVLQGHGGRFVCPPGACHRNWPLAIRVEGHILLFDEMFEGNHEGSILGVPSLWKSEQDVESAENVAR